MLLAPVVWILTAIIAYFFAAKTWWFPPPINAHGIAYDEQFMRTLMVTGVIFVLAQFALGWVIVQVPRRRPAAPATTTATTGWKPFGPAPPRCSSWGWC